MLQLAIYELEYVLQDIVINNIISNKHLIVVFLLHFAVALAQNTTGVTTANGCRQWKRPPSAPHEALRYALMRQLNGQQPTKQADVFWGGVEGVYGPQSAPLFRQ